ncbi:terpene synthase family protein [Nonomuraea sp. NPDC000554]|uniref:terpene synthase family protein n=1 Tax=Nonomuraea sp. NPDC000554 TaxID=3154259 RepID=UPI00332966AC
MTQPSEAFGLGRTCALAVAGGRDLAKCAARYSGLFPEDSFDAGLYASLALAGAFGSPWATAETLRAINRSSLLVFAADRLIDEVATSRDEVAALVGDCLAAAGGAAPTSPITAFLADLRAELATAPRFAALEAGWRDQLELMLLAMAREWDWRQAGDKPTDEEYLANADSCGASFISVSHWIYTGLVDDPGDLGRLRAAGDRVQRYLRLLNDLATHQREAGFGDLNALALGMSPGEVTQRMAELSAEAVQAIEPLRSGHPRATEYLLFQIDYSTGFYGISDFWARGES